MIRYALTGLMVLLASAAFSQGFSPLELKVNEVINAVGGIITSVEEVEDNGSILVIAGLDGYLDTFMITRLVSLSFPSYDGWSTLSPWTLHDDKVLMAVFGNYDKGYLAAVLITDGTFAIQYGYTR